MLTQDSRNFLAWGYRRTVVSSIEKFAAPQVPVEVERPATVQEAILPNTSMAQSEFEYTTQMINSDLSNFSAWHHRSRVLPRLLHEKNADDKTRQKFLDDELSLVERALYTGDNDQSPWFYHQYLMCTFDEHCASRSMAPDLSREERLQYVQDEIEKVMDMLDGAEDNKWIYLSLIQMVILYKNISERWPEQAKFAKEWVGRLRELDPLRSGRWQDLGKQLETGMQL